MNKKIYPSSGQAFVILLFMLVSACAGIPGFLPYLIWKNEYTYSIGNISVYLAAFIIPSVRTVTRIKESGDSFSLTFLFSKKMNVLQIVYLSVLTALLGICIDYVIKLLKLPDFFTAEIDRSVAVPVFGFIEVAVLPALFEELLLRGIILEQFLKRYSATRAILLSALLFGIMHGNPSQIFAGFIAGCFIGWVYFKTKNLKYCILIHFVNNSISWMEYELGHHFQQNAFTKYILGLETDLPAFCIAGIALCAGIFLLNKKYEKTRFKLRPATSHSVKN